ncbi:MAG TPA: hypothetical protein VFL79_00350 [Terriglobia bacterium]|nr:hypothetical protein [Terriglobia bacterium]
MLWIIEISVLLILAVVLRRILHMGRNTVPEKVSPRFRRPANNPLCSPLLSEVDAHSAILGVVLNDAINELASGNPEIARSMLGLFNSERERLVELAINMQNIALKYLPTVQYPIEGRSLDPVSFRSEPVTDILKRHGGLEQFVYRSKLRFQLQLRLLRRATALLNESFEEARYRTGTCPEDLRSTLSQLDLYYHDLDLLAKETILGFSEELAALPDTALADMTAEISMLTSRNSVAAAPALAVRH